MIGRGQVNISLQCPFKSFLISRGHSSGIFMWPLKTIDTVPLVVFHSTSQTY